MKFYYNGLLSHNIIWSHIIFINLNYYNIITSMKLQLKNNDN